MMRLRICKSSSQELVLDDEGLLTLILLRVPYRKLMSLKCVSRQWYSLIKSPHFTRLRNLLPFRAYGASGLFIQRPTYPDSNKVYFVPLDDPDTPSPFRTLTFDHEPFDPQRLLILRSCNGLLLCSDRRVSPHIQGKCYVYNPSTNQLASLPRHPLGTRVQYIGLAFDPSKSPHYKVIAFVCTSQAVSVCGLHHMYSPTVGGFHIYSSETGTWRVFVESFSRTLNMCFQGGVYWHGCIHWIVNFEIKSVNDDSALSDNCLYFNVDECRLETFPSPPIGVEWTRGRTFYLGESEDHLHFIEVRPCDTSLTVYEIKSDYSEWFVKYRIDLAPVSKVFPEMTKSKPPIFGGGGINQAVAVLSLVRRENFHEDSFLVLEIPGKAIRYNLVDRSFKVIWDFAVDFGLEKVECWAFGMLKVWQYIEAPTCV